MYRYYNPVTVVYKSWIRHAIRGGVVRRSCSGPFNQSRRSHAEVVSCDRYTTYYKSHGAVCLFRSRRHHGVHVAPCDCGIRGSSVKFKKKKKLADHNKCAKDNDYTQDLCLHAHYLTSTAEVIVLARLEYAVRLSSKLLASLQAAKRLLW